MARRSAIVARATLSSLFGFICPKCDCVEYHYQSLLVDVVEIRFDFLWRRSLSLVYSSSRRNYIQKAPVTKKKIQNVAHGPVYVQIVFNRLSTDSTV